MVGTLTVQNIQGPASGANANKIIIPSGQTLDASAGFVPPAGSVVQLINTTDEGFYSSTATNYTEMTSNYRMSITPKYSNSIIVLEWAGLVGGNNSTNIKNIKFWNLTDGAEIKTYSNPTGRTLAHASWRQVDADNNDRDNLIMKAYLNSWGTTARTFTVLFKTEGTAGYMGATPTNNAGCTYVPTVMTVTEIAG